MEESYILEKQKPCLAVKWLKEEKPVIMSFTSDEVKAMIDAYKMKTYLEARNKLIMMMFADTSIRSLELCHLMCSNIGDTTIKIILTHSSLSKIMVVTTL